MKPTVSARTTSAPSSRRTLRKRRIERGERLIGDEHVAPEQRVEQRRLPGIRVADERDDRRPLAAAALLAPPRLHVVQLAFEMLDAQPDLAPIHLEFRLAGSARADAAAEARQRVARSDEVRRAMAQLRQLDLQLALTRARVLREDVEDDAPTGR